MADLMATRDAYGKILVELGRKNPDIVVLDADLSCSTKTNQFAREFPDRFFNVGIAEQNLIGFASGLAAAGKTAFASTFAIFATGRGWEQIRSTVAYSGLNVKIVCSHAGISVGPDGASHQSLEDIAIMRSIPGMNVIVPCDGPQTKKAVAYAAGSKKPFYIRLGRPKIPCITSDKTPFEFGRAQILKQGKDVTLIGCGIMVEKTLLAAQELEKKGISARVINMHTIKPIDVKSVEQAARQTGAIVTCEEHNIIGGLGGAVAEVLCETTPVPLARIGVRDRFGQSGTPEELLKTYSIDTPDIVAAALDTLKRKKT